jgi:hypothetical protein
MGSNWDTLQGEHVTYCKCLDSTSNPTRLPSTQLHYAQAFAHVGEYVWTICALSLNTPPTPFNKTTRVFCFLQQLVEVDLPPFIDDFHLEMEVTLNQRAFIYVLVYSSCFSSNGFSPMVYEFWQDCFVPNDFANDFQYCVCSISQFLVWRSCHGRENNQDYKIFEP